MFFQHRMDDEWEFILTKECLYVNQHMEKIERQFAFEVFRLQAVVPSYYDSMIPESVREQMKSFIHKHRLYFLF